MDLTIRERKLLEYAMAQAADMMEDVLSDNALDHEYRICLLELGIEE